MPDNAVSEDGLKDFFSQEMCLYLNMEDPSYMKPPELQEKLSPPEKTDDIQKRLDLFETPCIILANVPSGHMFLIKVYISTIQM